MKEATVKAEQGVPIEVQKVTVLRRKGAAALVEWFENDQPHRRIVKVSDLVLASDKRSGEIPVEQLAQGIDYGFPWREALTAFTVTPEQIEQALHQNGIWTAEDAARDPSAVLGAISSTYQPVFAMIAAAIKQNKHKESSNGN